MDKFFTVSGIQELFGFKDARTARKVMREMEHTERPLMVTERAVNAWVAKKTLPPESEIRRRVRKGA